MRGAGRALVAFALALALVGTTAVAQGGSGAVEKLAFDIEPERGTQGGGTHVTLTLHNREAIPSDHDGQFWCKFGEKRVPAQSFFVAANGQPSVLCQTPSAAPRPVTVRLSYDGKRFHNGPRYIYTGQG